MEIEVKGHSGCSIEIIREDKDLYVCKSSHDPKYVPRLIIQAEKQRHAALEEYQHVRIPQIFDVVQDEKHAVIKMEYVYSRNFIEYFETAGFEQIDYFIKALILFVEKELKESPVQKISTSITVDKFNDVYKKTPWPSAMGFLLYLFNSQMIERSIFSVKCNQLLKISSVLLSVLCSSSVELSSSLRILELK